MADSPPEGSSREEGGAGPGREAPTQDPGSASPTFFLDRTLAWVAARWLDSVWSFVKSSLFAQTGSPSSPPASQAQAIEENEVLKEENQQPTEQLQEDEFVKVKDLTIQVRVAGRTGDCVKDFLNNVTEHLCKNEIFLNTENYQEDSGHFLLVFCPVSSRVGTDMENAMEGLQGEPKAVLIMLHHRPKEYDHFLDTELQARHPALVRTVHARYTLESGFYECQMNEDAVTTVAEVLKGHFKEEQEDSATPGPTTDSGDQACLESLP